MRAPTNKLTDTAVRNTKPREAAYSLADGGGMYLEVRPTGSRYWRLKYRIGGKEKLLALGVYPDVSLTKARDLRAAARELIAVGTDPMEHKREQELRNQALAANTFESIAREWHADQIHKWTERYGDKVLAGLKSHIFPKLGKRPIAAITGPELLRVLKEIQKSGTIDRGNRLRQTCGEVFTYAIASERADSNPAQAITKAMQPTRQTHYAALTSAQLPAFLKALDSNSLALASTTRLGLLILALTFVRPGELRQAKWSEFDLEAGEWVIPAERMKMRVEHIVPLSSQAIDALTGLQAVTGKFELLFPGRSSVHRPISDNTFRKALHDMGFMVTAHGFRSTASTILNEKGFRHDVVERQLSHGDRDKIRAAYNRAQYLDERKKMMQWWGTHLDALRTNNNVVPLKTA